MRLFFAYWPSEAKALEFVPWVQKAHALFGGRMMRTETLHMTLAFLGTVDPQAIAPLREACAQWRLPTGRMVLQRPGRFPKAKVVWLGPEDSADTAWLYLAYDTLWAYLKPLGWEPREAGFRPHVSLLRNADQGDLHALQGTAVEWIPGRCVLVGSQPDSAGSRYTVLAELAIGTDFPTPP